MKILLQIVLGSSFLLGFGSSFACDYPGRPHIPDGSTASKDEMIAAKTAVQTFLTEVDEYLRCVETEERAAIDAVPEDERDEAELQERELALNRTFDAANEEKALVGEQFNKQVRAYNANLQQAQE